MTQSVYIDLETTGLNDREDFIIEVGIALVEGFTVVDMFRSIITHPAVIESIRQDTLDPFIKNMHGPDGSGLIQELERSWDDSPGHFYPFKVEQRACEVVESWNLGKVPVYGSSVHFDRRFMAAQLPTLDAMFHYRCVDSTSQFEFVKANYPHLVKAIETDPTKADSGNHDVVSDIFYSVDLQRRLDKWVYGPANGVVNEA